MLCVIQKWIEFLILDLAWNWESKHDAELQSVIV